MEFQKEESGKGEGKVCKPGGVPVYGRVSALVAEQLSRGIAVKGLRLWYRCASCQRTVRIEEEANHNSTFHVKVNCHQCEGMIDRHQLIHHQRSACPKLKTFCEYCSTDTTLDGIEGHYDTCPGAKEAKSRHVYPPVPSLVNIRFPPDSVADDLVKLGSKMSAMSIAYKFPLERLKKYKSPFGYQLFQTKDGGNAQVDDVSESLARRHHHQLNQQKKALCKYFAKKLMAPQDKIKHFLQSYVLNRETEMMLSLIAPAQEEQAGKPAGSANVTQSPVRPNGIQPNQYTRIIHDVTGSLCRQDARRFEEYRRRQLIVKNVTKLNRRLSQKSMKENQEFVIRQAVALEKNKVHGVQMPREFLEGVKETRPVWGDLGLNLQTKLDVDGEKQQERKDQIKSYLRISGVNVTDNEQ